MIPPPGGYGQKFLWALFWAVLTAMTGLVVLLLLEAP